VTAKGLYYIAGPTPERQYLIQFLNLSTGKSRPVVASQRPVGALAVSILPDERFVVFTQLDQSGSDLMLIDNFVVR
jgi:hypothetical protein